MGWVLAPALLLCLLAVLAVRHLYPRWLENRAESLLRQERYHEALECLRTAGEIWADRHGEDCVRALAVRAELAKWDFHHGRAEAGSRMLDVVTGAIDQHQGRSDQDYARMLQNLGHAQTKAGRKGEAVATWELLRDLQERLYGSRHPEVSTALTQLGSLYSQLGDHEKAYEYLDRALDIRQAYFGSDSQEAGLSLSNLAGALAREGRWPEALDAAERGVGILQSKRAPEYPHALDTLSRIHESRGRLAEAESLRARACHLLEDITGARNAWLAQWLEDRASLLRRMERNTEASLLEQRAAGIREAIR